MRIQLVLITAICVLSSSAAAQQLEEVDLLALVDTNADTPLGEWEASDAGLIANVRSTRGMCVIPYELTGDYELTCEFTRENGSDLVGILLPLGQGQVLLELSGWNGEAHGLARIDGASSRAETNPTSVRLGRLTNGERQRIIVKVKPGSDRLSIQATLNDQELFEWSGPYDRVQPHVAIRIDSNNQPALFVAESNTVFHKFSVRHGDGDGKAVESARARTGRSLTPAPYIEPGKVDLTKMVWSEKRGSIDTVEFQGEEVVRTLGDDDTVALLPGAELGDGTIEVEIASDIFSGVAFRGADTENYDLIYFRPQNSGTAKHRNTVQYVAKGIAGADWRTLRSKFPGKYEAGATMKVNQWFHVRIELEGETARTYVNDSEEPVLVVEKLLGGRGTGKIGLWGWNSHFRNFSFQPATAKLGTRAD